MRRLALLALLCVAARGDEPGLTELFDPFSGAFPASGDRLQAKQATFEHALQREGVAAAIRALRGCEAALDRIQERIDKEYAAYVEAGNRYWGWRWKNEGDSAVPPALNRDYINRERAWLLTLSIKRRERAFFDFAETRLRELVPQAHGRAKEALLAGLKDRNDVQRLRCAELLRDVAGVSDTLLRGAIRERQPSVAAALVASGCRPGEDAGLEHVRRLLAASPWPARAGAARGLARIGTEAARALLQEAHAEAQGRLRDDFAAALGQAVEAGPVSCFGFPSSSRALLYCIDASVPEAWPLVRDEVARSIDALPGDATFGLVVFGRVIGRFRSKPCDANGTNKAAARAFLAAVEPGGVPDLHGALMAALDLADGGRNRAPVADTLFLFALRTAGSTLLGNAPMFNDAPQIAQEVTARNRLMGVRIHALGVSGGREAFYLQTITGQFGGGFREVG